LTSFVIYPAMAANAFKLTSRHPIENLVTSWCTRVMHQWFDSKSSDKASWI